MDKTYIILVIGIILLIGGIYLIKNSTNNEDNLFLVDSGNWSFRAIDTSQVNCSSMNWSGINFNMPELENITSGERAGFTYGYVLGMNKLYVNGSMLSIKIECENKTFEKVYNNFSDFTGEDDCVEDNLCFIRYTYEVEEAP